MNNYIKYYYNIDIINISCLNSNIFIEDVNHTIYYLKSLDNIMIFNYFDELSDYLLHHNSFYYPIIKNNAGNFITKIDGKNYILLKCLNDYNNKININTLNYKISIDNIFLYSKLQFINRSNWVQLWEKKIDYYEQLFSNIFFNNMNFVLIFNFFIGVSESSLLYLKINNLLKRDLPLFIQHNRISHCDYYYNYFDPSEIIIDYSCRDYCEYIKSLFIHNKYKNSILAKIIEDNCFSKYELMLMYSRIVFPSFFFDVVDSFLKTDDYSGIISFEDLIDNYIYFLNDISMFFSKRCNIDIIPWTIKKK